MAKASDNLFPYVHLVPAAAPASPAAGAERLYLDSGDSNKLKRKNSSGTVTTIESSGGGGASASGCRANTTAAAITLTHGTGVTLAWENEDYDDASYHDTVTNNSRFTAPATGRYRLTFVYAVSAARSMYLSTRLNGTTIVSYATGIGDNGTAEGQCIATCTTGIIPLTSGDYLECLAQMFKAAGSGTTTRATGVPAWATFERIT